MNPNRSRSGAATSPVRVVAPTSVKFGKSSRIGRAEGPRPIMTSRRRSSIAGYRTSSTDLESRWISSMNRTSPSWRSVSSAARSPGRESTGPDVIRIPEPISTATMLASEVLPRPGGPANKR